MAAGARYKDSARTAQETFLPLLRVFSFPGKRVHRAVVLSPVYTAASLQRVDMSQH
jgi:hypothetical protein